MKPKTESDTALPMVIGVDIGKEVFHLIGFGGDGKIVFRRKIKRLGFAAVFEKVPPCIVGMEACLSAHFVSRTLRTLGHEPRIIPAIYVSIFTKIGVTWTSALTPSPARSKNSAASRLNASG